MVEIKMIDEELYLKFPKVLRTKLLSKEIKLPDSTQFEYTKIYTYRAVERKDDDNREVTMEDFKSYFELGKTPKKKPRGVAQDYTKDPHYYGTSSYLKRECVEQIMRFPNPNKKIAAGYVYCEGGPQSTNDNHVCWWLYEEANVSEFKLIKEENYG
ncbi:hypothetical protein [Gemella morbillorum]|uniref:hypothetical protein n=1 Tax=Gemella morbillorum TaxID=29391 RepID=UPI0028D48475|nr:hypothetical protein [Gemella morbillorum]